MDVFWPSFILLNCFVLSRGLNDDSGGNSTDPAVNVTENATFKVELFPPSKAHPGQTRMPRKFFQKIHSGAAFLTGLKLGTILSKKGFELGHGKIASTHSFQIFGKSVNSAMSLSYGNSAQTLPLLDEGSVPEVNGGLKRTPLKKEEDNVFHVTVIENPSPQTFQKLQNISSDSGDKPEDAEDWNGTEADKITENVVRLYNESDEKAAKSEENDFLKEHNNRVKDFNVEILKKANKKV